MSRISAALLLGVSFISFGAPSVYAQAPSSEEASVGEIVVTGTRVANRSRLDTVSPVDVVTAETLSNAGTTELNQALSIALPSFNFPRPAITDGTDTVRPATLRGLGPDQTLVLVNSKRRHSAALVNVNGSIGRGSSAADLNTVPGAAIGSIEVLRDGAAAQYGSDAIAGVLNVRLREASEGGGATLTYGQRMTSLETYSPALPAGATWGNAPSLNPKRDVEDGATATVGGWVGLPLGEQGFLTVSAEYRDQDNTIRAAPDSRQQFPTIAGGAFDPREQTIDRVNSWYGEPELTQYTLFANAGYDLANGVELYGWGSYQDRDALSAGFFRRAIQERVPPAAASQNIISIYPNGFLPKINAQVTDASAGGGARFDVGSWDLDASVVWGMNQLDFGVRDSLNVTLGPSSKRSFDAGGLEYSQVVANVGAVRGFDVGLASPLNVAVGVEARQENYKIKAGEPASYIDGGFRLNTTTLTFDRVAGADGSVPAGYVQAVSGAQVFPGFRPANVTDEDRTAAGAYVDVEANVTEKLLVSGAVRVESYSDFGENVNGKIAARYDFTDAFAVRGAASTGFRAPSLQQSFFTSTATNFVGGVPFEIRTVPAADPLARQFGGRALEAEESVNGSLGAVFRAGSFTLTADGYFIEVTDRIILSENIFPAAGVLPAGVSGLRFFINGVDTETTGLDIVATQRLQTEAVGDFDFTLSGSFNNTVISRAPAATIFGRVAQLTLLDGQPKEKVTFSTVWEKGPIGATFRSTYYGSVVSPGTTAAADVFLGQKTLVDLEGRFALTDGVELALGAENVFDVYPDATPPSLNGTGATPFSNYSPFGYQGRYVYGRVAFNW